MTKYMKMKKLGGLLMVCVTMSSCSLLDFSKIPGVPPQIKKTAYERFTEREDYPKTYDTFRNEELLKASTPSNTRGLIDLSDQRTMLLVNDQIALDSPTCTGRAGKRTPTGTFRIKEKIKDKRSTIFGRLYNGTKVVHGGDRRKYKGSYTKFIGSSLPYWMRLTGDGIGLHYSKSVKRYPASAGCVRMPMNSVKTIYSKVRRGTRVTVQN